MLTIHPAILGGLGICFVLLIWTLWEEHFIRFTIRGIGGMASLYLGNLLLPTTLAIEWNTLHIGIAILFGIPGTVMMFLIHYYFPI